MKSVGLLEDHEELRADRYFKGERSASGLVIDDFYTVSVESSPVMSSEDSTGAKMAVALGTYAQQKILGSPLQTPQRRRLREQS